MICTRAIILDSLTLPNVIRVLCSSKLRSAKAIYCKRTGRLGQSVFGGKLHVIPDHQFSANNGSSVSEAMTQETLQITSEHFSYVPNRYLRRWLQQAMTWIVFDCVGLVQDHQLVARSAGGATCVMVPLTPFLGALRERYQNPERELTWCFGHGRFKKSCRIVASLCIKVGRAVALTVVTLVSGIHRPSAHAMAVCVPNFRGGLDGRLRNDLFWLSAEKTDHPIIFEHTGTAYLLGEEFLAEVQRQGVRVVETHLRSRRIAGSQIWRPGRVFLKGTIDSIILFLKSAIIAALQRDSLQLWTAWHKFRFETVVSERLDFYRSYNIRAEFVSGFLFDEPAHSFALSQLDGLSCTAQYTTWMDEFGNYTSTSTFHLYFGDYMRSWNLPFFAEFNVLNGYLYKTPLAGSCDVVKELRERLASRGVRRSVCFLDENMLASPQLRDGMMGLYEYLIETVLREKDFGVVLKPKKNWVSRELEAEFGDRYHDAVSEGRFIILDWSYYPGMAAQVASLTIGTPTTAALESAVMGCRTIYFNALKYVPPFMTDVKSNIHETIPEVIAAIQQFFQCQDGSDIGRHPEDFLRSIDHYRDTEVSDRIRYLMMTYVTELQRGGYSREALERTVKGFSDRWPLAYVDKKD